MRYWKRQGVTVFDWGGGGEYKEKYGVRPVSIPWFCKPRYRVLGVMRQKAKRLFDLKQRLMGRLQGAENRQQGTGGGEQDVEQV